MSPEVDSKENPATVPAKVPRRAAKASKPAKAPKVARERKPRTAPVRNLHNRLAARGLLDAYKFLAAKRPATFKAECRDALAGEDLIREANAAVEKAKAALVEAERFRSEDYDKAAAGLPTIDLLEVTAKRLAAIDAPLLGDVGPGDPGEVPVDTDSRPVGSDDSDLPR